MSTCTRNTSIYKLTREFNKLRSALSSSPSSRIHTHAECLLSQITYTGYLCKT